MEGCSMRMTVDEMRRSYPNTCIGITDIEYDDRERIVSGDVKYTDKTEKDLLMMAVHRTGIVPFYTSTSDNVLTMGALSV